MNEDEDVLEEDEEAAAYARRQFPVEGEEAEQIARRERAPLLGSTRRSMSRHRRTKSGHNQGTASITQAVLMVGQFSILQELMNSADVLEAFKRFCWYRYLVHGQSLFQWWYPFLVHRHACYCRYLPLVILASCSSVHEGTWIIR